MRRGSILLAYGHLVEPHITEKPDEHMLVVKVKGAPDKALGLGFKTLYTMYSKIKGVRKGAQPPAPRARWYVTPGMPPEDWVAHLALPVPSNATLPAVGTPGLSGAETTYLQAELALWPYGTIAEILHIGSYDSEAPTIDKLKSYIIERGYERSGQHEEEYLKGPRLLIPANPKHFLTIIRMPVRKI